MPSLKLQLIAAITVTIASVANAAPVRGLATLASPAVALDIVGADGIWHCSGNSCSGATPASTSAAVAVCSAVAAANGRVTAFTAGTTSFADAELKRCNRHVK